MALDGWMYLHQNGNLIYKRNLDNSTREDIQSSDFSRAVWPFDKSNRLDAWTILVEAGAVNADKARITELAQEWQCTDTDASVYAECVGIRLQHIANTWWALPSRQDSHYAGYGESALDALIMLCREMHFKASKHSANTFEALLHRENSVQSTN